jgi:tripartite-type tricarboxylate transporter receptor subunit TctC
VAHVDDFLKSEDDRKLSGLIFGVKALSRVYVSPPSIPDQRRNAVRAAFVATMNDPRFLADATEAKIDISPMTGEEVQAFVGRVSNSSPAVVARAKQAFRLH